MPELIEEVEKYYTRNGIPMKYVVSKNPAGKVIAHQNTFRPTTDTEIDQLTYDSMVEAIETHHNQTVLANEATRAALRASKAADASAAKTKLMALGLTEAECDALIGV